MPRIQSTFAVALVITLAPTIVFADEPAPTAGESDSSRDLSQAMQDLDAHRYAEACPGLARAYQVDLRPGTLFYLAECYEKWGRIASAAEYYEAYLAKYHSLSGPEQKIEREREGFASMRAAALRPRVPTVILRVDPHAPAGLELFLVDEGHEQKLTQWNKPIALDPGGHKLKAVVPGGREEFTTFTLHEGKQEQNEPVKLPAYEEPTIDVPDNPGGTTPRPPLPLWGPSPRRIATYILGSVGAASLIGSLVTGGLTGLYGLEITNGPNCGLRSGEIVCNSTGMSKKHASNRAGMASTILAPIGGIASVTALILYLTEPKRMFASTNTGPRWHAWAVPGAAGVEYQYRW